MNTRRARMFTHCQYLKQTEDAGTFPKYVIERVLTRGGGVYQCRCKWEHETEEQETLRQCHAALYDQKPVSRRMRASRTLLHECEEQHAATRDPMPRTDHGVATMRVCSLK